MRCYRILTTAAAGLALGSIVAACSGGGGGGSSTLPSTPGSVAAPGPVPSVTPTVSSSASPGGPTSSPSLPGATPTPAPGIPVSAALPTTLQEYITVGTTQMPGATAPYDTWPASGNGPIDGATCDAAMHGTFHHHVHITIFSGTTQYILPMAIGMYQPTPDATNAPPYSSYPAGSYTSNTTCFYWVHVHDHSGIVHIEAPNTFSPTLKNVFDEWGIPLSRTQVGPLSGTVRVYTTDIDAGGQPTEFTGDPNTIPLNQHLEITIFVNPVYGAGGNSIPTYTWTF